MIDVPSSGLDRTNGGVIALGELGTVKFSCASSSMKAEKRICKPAVPLTEATLPASVLMLYLVCPEASGAKLTAHTITANSHVRRTYLIDFSSPELGYVDQVQLVSRRLLKSCVTSTHD